METNKVEVEHLTIKPVETGNYRYTIEIDKSVFEDLKRNDICNYINQKITTITEYIQEVYEMEKSNDKHIGGDRCMSRGKDNQIQERLDKLFVK